MSAAQENKNEGLEDVNDFLLRIRELGDKRDKEDEERARKLEEEILQGRRERQARRADTSCRKENNLRQSPLTITLFELETERARSISPTKDSPLSEQAGLPALLRRQLIDPPENLQPSFANDTEFNADSRPGEIAMVDSELAGATGPTLPWQHRLAPGDLQKTLDVSTVSTSRSKMDAADPENDMGPLRGEIASSLGSKDPSWFRQTADRGIGSPALRKGHEESIMDISQTGSSVKLPGLSRESTSEPEKLPDQELGGNRSRSPSRASSTFGGSSIAGNRYSSVSSVSTMGGLGSPIPLSSSQRLEARKAETTPSTPEDQPPTSSSRNSLQRPASPTKGLGGFVQSAMMKRSDSISKRWSTQVTPGLNRSNSSNRSGNGRSSVMDLNTGITDALSTGESLPLPSSRPSSSHSDATVVHNAKINDRPGSSDKPPGRGDKPTDEGFIRPQLPLHTRSISSVSKDEGKASDSEIQTPKSPSRSVDSKRWSPTKATWLESALNRPESPRPKSQGPQQPAWLRDLGKSRQSKTSVDLGRSVPFNDVSATGLMRSPPPGGQYKKPSISGLPDTLFPSETANKDAEALQNAEENTSISEIDEHSQSSPENPLKQNVEPDVAKDSAIRKDPPAKLKLPLPITHAPDLGSPKNTELLAATDFRANLRRREVASDGISKKDPEFKNAFGKLRRVEKSNYVAPNELKENILRGKAALNITGGPKKSQRIDELKESILKQKEAMKAGGGFSRRTTSGDKEARPKLAPAIPESISRRNNLSRIDSTKSTLSSGTLSPSPSERSIEKQLWTEQQSLTEQIDNDTESVEFPEIESAEVMAGLAIAHVPITKSARDLDKDVNLDASVNNRQPMSEPSVMETNREGPQGNVIQPVRALLSRNNAEAAKAVAVPKGLTTKGTLADRLNPALAGFWTRGPPLASGESKTHDVSVTTTKAISHSNKEAIESTSSIPLMHMTKARAKGPKRRLPTTLPTEVKPTEERQTSPLSSTDFFSHKEPSASYKLDDIRPISSTPDTFYSAKQTLDEGPKPTLSRKSVQLTSTSRPVTPARIKPYEAREDKNHPFIKTSPPQRCEEPDTELPPKSEVVLHKVDEILVNSLIGKPTPPPKSAALLPSPTTAQDKGAQDISLSRFPITFPLKESFVNPSVSFPQKSLVGLGIESTALEPKQKSKPDPAVCFSQRKPTSPPPIPPKKHDMPLNSSVKPPSPVPRTTESTRVISNFFGTLPKSSDRVVIDPQLILMAKTDNSKIRTLRKQICEITSDGKKQDLPVNQEYILYEGSMYLCVHLFELHGGSKCEVHLWCGDEVGEAAIEDAQLFARKVARENSCKLEILRQGKETAIFMQALGGIIITRRGFSSRSSSSALYMLCGRRHLGQIAFDEVDFSRRNLCSGYPYVISAKFGKLYLWKGKGSGADEIGGARLIGMDLGLTGEIEEVAEGQEPDSFFEVFPDYKTTAPYQTSEHWNLKPNHEKFCCRLLQVDHELGQRPSFWSRRGSSSPVTRPNDTVREVEPFCQKDLTPRGIYVLDAFFELYVIIGEQASSRPTELASAIVFAQEYGILAASLQDRPFIPKSFVAIGGVPDSCKTAFRKWDRRTWQSQPQVLPLNAAIEAIRF
ncbi:hypothetical protein Egran_03566 [Elaphomyces granulatus]|uniref:DUF4045 domain-containing protein n=1 Tax=Elaphomyces granulatus TaxID=519963 RepID=A0A232LWY1_9EURO|nr:hypothetical protein Egran_03566 [Elaphomyces granulatus]